MVTKRLKTTAVGRPQPALSKHQSGVDAMDTFGQRMQAQRRRLGLSMKKLAQELGVCEKTICNWEHDEGCFPVGKLIPVCHALHWTPGQLLGTATDLDAAVKLQQVREVCETIGQITARLRQVSDFDGAKVQLVERDRLRNRLRALLDLPPLNDTGDISGELSRHVAWHDAKQEKLAIFDRYFRAFKRVQKRFVAAVIVSACSPAGGAVREDASPA
jgi:DNA-binding XRE family transcriptional regulator